jgi:Fe-S cluster biogenesis protein NfuA
MIPGHPRSTVEEQVRKTIEVIRPAIQADNGDIFLRSVDESTGVVVVELTGACVSCPASTVTLKAGVERILKDRVPGVTAVEQYGAEPAETESAVFL